MKNKRIIAYLTCEKFQSDFYATIEQRYKATLNKGVVIVEIDDDEVAIVFSFGACIFWNVSYDNTKFFLDFLKESEINSFEESIVEEFDYAKTDSFSIKLDTIFLDDEDSLLKIALSYAMAQSIKVEEFEKQIENSIDENAYIPLQLSKYGKINLNKKEVSKKIGELFLVKSKINLHYDLLDTPDFFWEYPECERYYEAMIRYLDVNSRLEVLNKKVEIIQELLNVLSNEQNHKYSSFLEWIIILLIAFEIVFNLAEHFLK